MTRNNTYEMPAYPQEPPPAYASFRPNRDVAQHSTQIPTTTPVLVRTPHIALVVDTASVDSERPVPSPTRPTRSQERTRNNDAHIDIPLADAVSQAQQANDSTPTPTRQPRSFFERRRRLKIVIAFSLIAFIVYYVCIVVLAVAVGESRNKASEEENCKLEAVLYPVVPLFDCRRERSPTAAGDRG
jgi:hypothetical protein